MTYIDYLNAFNRWLENNYLPMSSQLLYFRLLDVFNRCAWAEWVSVDNLRMMSMIQAESKHTLLRARDKLIQAGFLEYRKGRKGVPNQYRLLYGANSARETAPQTAPINRTKTKTEENITTTTTTGACARDEGLGRVVSAYLDMINPTPSQTSMDELKG